MLQKLMEHPYNKALQAAVDWLYTNNRIKKDLEIAERTGHNKGVVSNYINGKLKASENFLQKFAEAYNIDLSEFEEEVAEIPAARYMKKTEPLDRVSDIEISLDSLKSDIELLLKQALSNHLELLDRLRKLEQVVFLGQPGKASSFADLRKEIQEDLKRAAAYKGKPSGAHKKSRQ